MNDRPQPQPGPPRPVSPPSQALPQGAWDCHAHVFGPFDRFPVLAERRYEPPLAPAETYLAMLDTVGFAHGVIVHASAKGFDMANVADAVARRPDRLVGVAVVAPDADEAVLHQLHAQGFRGVRFTETGRHEGRAPGTLYFEDLGRIAPWMKALGWHIDVWGRCDRIMAHADQLRGYGLPIIFDHLAYPDAEKGPEDATFQAFLRWLPTGDFWVKTTPVRIASAETGFAAARPFHEAVLRAVPGRVVFGSDWPYLALDANLPDVGRMVDLFDAWTPDAALRRRILVDNPSAFYARG